MLRRLLITLILVVLGLPLALAENIVQVSEQAGQGNAYVLTDGYTNSGVETLTVSNLPVYFSFNTDLDVTVPNPVNQNESALLTLSVRSTEAGAALGGLVEQGGFSGSFTIIDNSGGVNQGYNLLSGTFAGSASVSGISGGTEMTLSDTDTGTLPNEVQFTSAYLSFVHYSGTEAASFTLSNLSAALTLDLNDFLESNTGSGVDTFSATPQPPVTTAEPETLLLSGAALLGIGLFLRKRKLQPYF
jgi:hypothetical protein